MNFSVYTQLRNTSVEIWVSILLTFSSRVFWWSFVSGEQKCCCLMSASDLIVPFFFQWAKKLKPTQKSSWTMLFVSSLGTVVAASFEQAYAVFGNATHVYITFTFTNCSYSESAGKARFELNGDYCHVLGIYTREKHPHLKLRLSDCRLSLIASFSTFLWCGSVRGYWNGIGRLAFTVTNGRTPGAEYSMIWD